MGLRFHRFFYLFLFIGFTSGSLSTLNAKEEELSYIEKDTKSYKMVLRARNFAQGEVIQVRIQPKKKRVFEEKFKFLADGKEVLLSQKGSEFIGFIPIHPERKPEPMLLEIHSKVLFVKAGVKKFEVDIHPTDFLVIKKQSIKLNKKYTQKKYDPKTLSFIRDCTNAKNQAFASKTDLQFHSGFVDPVKYVSFSSPFYVRRDYNNKKGRPHGGMDYRGKSGTPIFAINDGIVVLSRKMYFEGNFTIIDHGNKIFSFYMHQSKLLVKPGQKVKRGERIGLIGSTGMSTGPHLHLGVKVNGTLVHPLSLLAFREL